MREAVRITVDEFAAKARDKPECYHLLAHEYGAYLPHIDCLTMWFLRDLAAGKKKAIKGTEIKHLTVPQFEKLTIDEFLKFASDYPFATMCLPDRKQELDKLPRQYIINVIYTKVGEPFRQWVEERVGCRHEKVKEKDDLYVELDPEIAKVFQASKAVSTNNGRSYQMMKASAKPRRSKEEIKQAKLTEEAEKLETELKLRRYEEMQR